MPSLQVSRPPVIAWTSDEISKLKRVVKSVSDSIEKQERWNLIAEKLDTGKTKRECFNMYRELKVVHNDKKKVVAEQEAAKAAALTAAAKKPATVVSTAPADKPAATPAAAKTAVPAVITAASSKEVPDNKETPPGSKALPASASTTNKAASTPAVAASKAGTNTSAAAKPAATTATAVKAIAPSTTTAAAKPTTTATPVAASTAAKPATTTTNPVKPAATPAAAAKPVVAAVPVKPTGPPFNQKAPSTTLPMTSEIANQLRILIFGDTLHVFNDSWKKQGFFFTKEDKLTFGLVQIDGGPCGAIAAVQSFILRHLLFGTVATAIKDATSKWKEPTKKEQKNAVATAISRMIWLAATSKVGTGDQFQKIAKPRPAQVCTVGETTNIQRSKSCKHDGVTEKINITTCYNYEDVFETVKDEVSYFMQKDGGGVVCLVYSCLLSRGLEEVENDMDSNFGQAPKMIGNHGYANQEMVNLFLTGYATSNLFDGEKRFEDEDTGTSDCIVMRGVGQKGDVGFLTLFEAFQSVEVGVHLKTPTCPIWVVCSESHYSCLFSPLAKHVTVDDKERKLDIFYYDPLGEQEEEIRLSLNKDTKDVPDGGEETDLIPPIDKVIRTKWGQVGIDWNGVDPIL